MMRALLIDAYDSFVYILHQYLLDLQVNSRVVRNDQITPVQIKNDAPDFLLLGPGPGHPADSRYLAIMDHVTGQIPIFGVCLGMQAIGLAHGGHIKVADHLMHGKTSPIDHHNMGCFKGCPQPLQATRYHSLVLEEDSITDTLEITARASDDGYVMGVRHPSLALEGVQFHPESICTDHGHLLLANFIRTYVNHGFSLPRRFDSSS
ncbi:MAG: aminodeoxychorismate/anthranilate synthase component II [Pseudomonadota bacterium]